MAKYNGPKSAQAAADLLESRGVIMGVNFHSLGHKHVEAIAEAARDYGYKKSPDAPGSTARMFYQYANKAPKWKQYNGG